MTLNRTIELSIDGTSFVRLDVEFIESLNGPDQLRVAIKREWEEVAAEAVWHVQERDGLFSLQITSQHVSAGICLAGCLAEIITSSGPLVDCLKKARSRGDVKSCIEQHVIWQVVGSLSCIYGCLNV